jgi:hypothetical protein
MRKGVQERINSEKDLGFTPINIEHVVSLGGSKLQFFFGLFWFGRIGLLDYQLGGLRAETKQAIRNKVV